MLWNWTRVAVVISERTVFCTVFCYFALSLQNLKYWTLFNCNIRSKKQKQAWANFLYLKKTLWPQKGIIYELGRWQIVCQHWGLKTVSSVLCCLCMVTEGTPSPNEYQEYFLQSSLKHMKKPKPKCIYHSQKLLRSTQQQVRLIVRSQKPKLFMFLKSH